MPSEQRIAEAWRSYFREVVPNGADEVQIQETRRAFFAGAQATWAVLMASGSSPARDMAVCSDLDAELKAYIADFKRAHGV